MNTKYIAVVVGIVSIGIFGYLAINKKAPAVTDKVSVVASFYPLYFFAQEIGGDKADVRNITPAGAEPHDYEPTPQDLVMIQNSNLLVLNGAGLESWGADILTSVPAEKVVIAGEVFATLEGEVHEDEEHEEEDESEAEERVADPHVWLSPEIAIRIVDRIEQGYAKIDPENAQYYADNATSLTSRIAELDTKYRQGLAQCISRDIVTSHAAFGYLAQEFDLRQVPISGLSPEEEPSTRELAEIADFAKTNNFTYIFFESLASPKLSQAIATEVGAQTLVLDPIEGLTASDIASGNNYFTVMENNLVNLQTALQCTR